MTKPDLKQYATELAELENAPPAAIELPPLAAIAIVSFVQFASRHPSLADNNLAKIAIDTARQLQGLFNPESATYKMLELGWNPEEDRPFRQEPEIEPFEGFCKEPCENFTRNLGCGCTGYQVAEVVSGEDIPPEVLATGAVMMEKITRSLESAGFEVVVDM